MPANRLRGYLDTLCVLLCEIVGFAFFVRASSLLGTVDFSHLERWLQSTSPQVALTALIRLLGLATSGWLLLSTVLYAAALLSGKRGAITKSRAIILPVLRRVLDSLTVASVAASSIGSVAAVSTAAPVPRAATLVRSAEVERAVLRSSTRPAPTPTVAARVSNTATGRHFPHPGSVHHVVPERGRVTERLPDVPSEQNDFAGLPRGTKVVVVQPGDCLSVLAEQHLGDWRLDSEIEALNYGRPQPDGRALVDDHWIYVGWVLVMPPNAVGAIVVGERPAEHAESAAKPPDKPHAQEMPGTRPVHQRAAPARVTPSPTAMTSASTSGTTTSTTSATAMRANARHPAAVLPPAHQKTVSPPPPPAKSSDAPHDHHREDIGRQPGKDPSKAPVETISADLIVAAGIGAIAGGSIVWSLDRRRRLVGHGRLRGQRVPRNKPEVEAAESRARAIADAERVRWVDQALRYLSGLVEDMSLRGAAPLPSPALVKVGAGGLEVHVSPAINASLGWFSPSDDGTILVLDNEMTLEELEALADDHWPAWPALASLGETQDGELLLNLEHAGSVSVEGPRNVVKGFLGRLVLELATDPWSDDMLAGLYAVGDSAVEPVPGVQTVPTDSALDLAEKFDLVSGAQQELSGRLSLSSLRAVACEALPNVAVAFAGTPSDALQCLAESAVPEHSGIAMVGAGPFDGARWRLVLSRDGRGTLQGQLGKRPVSLELKSGCDPDEVALLGEALGSAANLGESLPEAMPDDAEAWHEEPVGAHTNGRDGRGTAQPERLSGPDPTPPQRGDVEICVMGPVDIAGGDTNALEPSRRMAAMALLAYMASHPRPVTAEEIASALWPLDATKDTVNGPQRKTVMNVISRARAVLGYSAAGKERIAYSPQGYRLTPDVTSDWSRFEKYVANARRQRPSQAMTSLRRALELVRGEPFAGALASQFFEWVASEHLDLTLSAKAVDSAQDLGQMALDANDLETVVWAVEKGLLLEPTREELFRLWMHALGREGRPAKVDDVYRRLKVVLRQRLHALQEPQPETREVWRKYTMGENSSSKGMARQRVE